MSLLQTLCAVLNAGSAPTVYNLSDMAASHTDVGGFTDTYGISVIFRTDGTVDVTKLINLDTNDQVDPYVSPTSETSNTWVRCTFNSGDDMTSGDTRGVWHRLDTERSFTQEHTTGGGNDLLAGNFDYELSSDASGSPIEATKAGVTTQVGELF